MNQPDYLSLRQVRLKPPLELEFKGDALYFIFSQGSAGKFSSSRANHRLMAGDVLVFNGVNPGKISPAEAGKEYVFSSFSVSFEQLLPLFSSTEISQLHVLNENFKTANVIAATTPLAKDCQRLLAQVPADFDLNHRGQLLRIAASLLAVEFKAIQAQFGAAGSENQFLQIFKKLSAAELISLSVGDLASRFNCSRRHLNRLFHQNLGVSVASLRMEMRMLKAVSLLRDGEAKIINIAEQCSFNHLGLFNTCFKRRFGVSPGQWRKTAVKPDNTTFQKKGNAKTSLLVTAEKKPVGLPTFQDLIAGKIAGGTEILADSRQRQHLVGTNPARQSGTTT